MSRKATFLGLVAILACSVAAVARAELAVIAHPSNPEAALTQDQIKVIYLGKKKKFPAGGAVEPVDQTEASPARTAFYAKVIGKDESQLKAYWSKLIFSGKGTPPMAVGADAEVKDWVAKHPNGLGYIDAGKLDDSVKVLMLIP